MNIYQKMLNVQSELNAVAKNLSVGVGRNSYKAVGEADVLAAVKPIEAKHGIYSYPYDRRIVSEQIMTTESDYNGKVTKKNNQFIRVETTYRFVNTDKPDEYVDIKSYGDGVDSQDKAPGKAMTYSDKYALLKAYKIITGDDPDQNYSQTGSFQKVEPSLASKTERKTLWDLCGQAQMDYTEVLERVGCKDKNLMTGKQYADALKIVEEQINGSGRKA